MTDQSESNSTTNVDAAQRVMQEAIADAFTVAEMAGDEGGRVAVNVNDDREMYDAAAELVGGGRLDYVYRNGGSLVIATEKGIEPLSANRLAAHVNRSVSFTRMVNDQLRFILLKSDIARQLADAPEMCHNARELRGIVTVPTPGPDGRVLATPGYDEETRYAYIPDGSRVDVPEWPSEDEVAEARDLVMTPFAEYPFEHGEDGMANAVGFMITPSLHLLVPGHRKCVLIEANQKSSGKSHVANGARIVYGGAMHPMPESEAEMKKSITAILSAPGSVIYFDNARGKMSYPSFEALLTADRWSSRILGSSRTVDLANDRVWAITSNNADVGGDLTRRALRIRIRTDADPGKKRFTIRNLDEWFTVNREAYLSAVLTLVRAWVIAGSPSPEDGESDSFSPWRRAVRGILGVAGVPGVFDSERTRVLETEEDEEWHAFLLELSGAFGDREFTMKEAAAIIDSSGWPRIDSDTLPGKLVDKWIGVASPSFTRSLGRQVDFKNGTWFGGLAVEYTGLKRQNAKLWRVLRYGQSRELETLVAGDSRRSRVVRRLPRVTT